ncbi:MAG TPA: ROK family protein [Gaiellaceae bacterium]|nr:ROK family protein [Gaiellaceae bacterium]
MSSDHVAALDIGGTHASAGVVALNARVVEDGSRTRVLLHPAGSGSEHLADIVRAASEVVRPDVHRLGVAVPGPFDYEVGISRIEHKLRGLYEVDLRSRIATAVDLPAHAVRFLNDAEAFLLGEWWAGAARGHARAVGITLGTGVGSAFVADDQIVRSGPNVPPGGELYALSFRGAPVEETISSRGLISAYGSGDERLDAEGVAAQAKAGEPAARRAFEELGRALGEFLTPWLRGFEPSCVVVGGSIARSWELFEPSLRGELESVASLETITAAAELEDAPLLGAGWYAGADG